MLKILGDFAPYGKEFIDTYPHLSECSQSKSTHSLKATDFTKLLEQPSLRRTTIPPPQIRTEQSYQLSFVPAPTLSTVPTPRLQDTLAVDEELYVQNNTVIWSRGRHIIKTFQYELQPVEMALFAWFPIDQPEYNDNIPSINQLITNRKRKNSTSDTKAQKKHRSTLSFTNSLIEAEQQSKYVQHLDNPVPSLPSVKRKDSVEKVGSKRLEKAACIILKDCIKVHFIDGKHHSIHLPFTVHHVIPSDIGLILERASQYNINTTNHHKIKKDPFASRYLSTSPEPSSPEGVSASPFLCLTHPAEEFKPIFFLDQLSMAPTSLFGDGDSSASFFQQQQLVYASFTADHPNDHDSLPTLVVTKSKTTGLHSIWRYQTVTGSNDDPRIDSSDDEFEKSKSFFQKTPSFLFDARQSQQQQHRQPKQDQTDSRRKQGRRSRKIQFGMKGGKRRQRQQKQQQVSPDSHFGSGGGNNNSSILYHSPSPTPSLTTRKDSFLAGSRSFIQGDEDASALSIIFSSDNNSMVALYKDALDDNYGEKCQLQHLWTEERRSYTNPSSISRGFISHNAIGLPMLCIVNETEGILIGLLVKDLLSGQHGNSSPVTGFHMDVKQALPMYNATRPGNVADILLLDHENNLSIFIDSQLPCLPILFSTKDQQWHDSTQNRFIKIHDAVDNRFNLVIMEKKEDGTPAYITKRCQINDITAGEFYCQSSNRTLVANSSMALRCAWSSSVQWALLQHQSLQLQKQLDSRLDGWEVFVITLISMIPLVPLSDSTTTPTSTNNGTHDIQKMGGLYNSCITKAYQLQRKLQGNNINYYITDPQNITLLMRSLHVLYQDYHLSKFFPKSSVALLGTLLWVLARLVGSSSWMGCYSKYEFLLKEYQLDTTMMQQDTESVSIGDGLISLDRPFILESWMHYHLPHDTNTTLSQLCGLPTLDPESSTKDETLGTDTLLTPSRGIQRRHDEFAFKLKMLWYIHHTMHFHFSPLRTPSPPLVNSEPPLSDTGRRQWIQAIVKKGYRRNDLELVPDTCILLAPLLDTLAYLQVNTPIDQPMDFYRFIGRNDIVAQLDHHQISSVMNRAASLSTCDLKSLQFSLDKKNGPQQNISQLVTPSAPNYTGLPGNTQALKVSPPTDLNLTQFFYGGGMSTLDTLKHVRLMLNPCHLVEMTVPDQPGISEENLDMINQGYLKDLMQRTLALSIGNGIFHYGHQHGPASTPSAPPPPSPIPNTNTETETSNSPLVTIEENINLSAKLLPLRRTVTWDDKSYRPDYFDWPRFHHGVATALRLSSPCLSLSSKNRKASSKIRMTSGEFGYFNDNLADDDKNDLSWLFYVEPEELNVFHGGLLFGLGLNGHLLPNLHWYRYITQSRCSLVTIGFILGTCVTFRGSKNADIIKILSVHIPALVASQSSTATSTATATTGSIGGPSSSSSGRIPGKDDDFMTSSCLFGLGLIFMGSCDRYMTTVMLNEIGNCSKRGDMNCSSVVGESLGGGRPTSNMESACALAAGFALGFIMLGKGGNTSKELGGLPDAQLFDTLYQYMTGKTTNPSHTTSSPSSTPPHQEQKQAKATQVHYAQDVSGLLDITTPAATIALGLAYLKTENHRIAERLDISDTTIYYLNYVRPDFLLLRVVAKNLILWQSISPCQAWIDAQLPSFMHTKYKNHSNGMADGMDEQVINQAKYNIIAGACLCLGLRFAGSQDQKAFQCLLNHFDTFLKLAVAQTTTVQDHITKSAVWVCIDVLATAAAMVMAGSGNEELYRRLKILHDRIPFGGGTTGNGKYSNHMASHMALGLLFCGLGRYTLKTTNEAIAGLLCSFYPFYPIDSEDQRSHLQAFRHLWMIGLDQRWLTPFDCDTKQPCQVPLLLTTTVTDRCVAPSVVPNYDTVARIRLDSSLYYPLDINMQIKGDYQQAIRQSGILFVQRKKANHIH